MVESLTINIGLFAVAAFVIGIVGTRLTKVADRLADKTGWGEAVFGAIFLGGSTSLPGIVASVTAAWGGHPELAVSNAVGGIAAQTVFLSIADLFYRQANLEHAAASPANLMQGSLLITLLSLPFLAMSSTPIDIWGIHPASFLLIAAYIFGMRLVSQAKTAPMWAAKRTAESRFDEPEEEGANSDSGNGFLWMRFCLFAVLLATAGYVVAESGVAIASRSGLSQTIVGSLFTAISTSLPELITSVAAVRSGALTLAVSDIIGGNTFDVLFLAFSDFAYRDGSIYHTISQRQIFIISLTILLTGILLLGLLRREKRGIGNIGFESFLILIFYLGGFWLLFSS
ncbi:sodium:calcium antiporter [Calothrix sp. CCY 0018]|uniref:sodium:calcium antiporter n=1 Tax=Calothrix sp. CCY 0018 TaxID=3103864 RepID=UPI0039C5B4BC